uniref:TNFR-Cys domain-containing protein n=1 Tax=Mastacembelus armatus TaxID=205130 RepID=A0A3Q3N1Q0_9TELE
IYMRHIQNLLSIFYFVSFWPLELSYFASFATWLQVEIVHCSQDCGFGDAGIGVCMPCEKGHYSSDTSVAPCKRCTKCRVLNRLEKRACAATSDAMCGQCLRG